MTHHTRGLSGKAGAPVGSSEAGDGATSAAAPRSPKFTPSFWVSRRGGPFLIHTVAECDPKARGCKNSLENLIEQGFMHCPKCMG